ncbi:MAG: hypothetical protein R3D89_11285 [Sphingomonadaceae bacterium]
MTRGGDARIVLDPATGLNRYFSVPVPREIVALSSSTVNDISAEAHEHLKTQYPHGADHLQSGPAYGDALDAMRAAIRTAYSLPESTDIFFAPSGTDLEYVGLLAVAGRRAGGIDNHLLGADEVGSGCIHSAAGHYFANETALGAAVSPGEPVAGLPPVAMSDSPVRCDLGEAFDSGYLSGLMAQSIERAIAQDRASLVHVVHGSKTGLVQPVLDDIDRLRARFGQDVTFVVDACQARITAQAINDYLARGMIVFVTGSKFMGGPPFSGFALLPAGLAARAAPLAGGVAKIFRRAEVPASWPGREICEDTGNPGLALRLEASLFELARFQAIPIERVSRIVRAFSRSTDALTERLGIAKVASAPAETPEEPRQHPIEMLTLDTMDLCHDKTGRMIRHLSFEDAVIIHKSLVDQGIRLGQPVRCVRQDDGSWGATLRIGLSMPQVIRLDAADEAGVERWFAETMAQIGDALDPLLN